MERETFTTHKISLVGKQQANGIILISMDFHIKCYNCVSKKKKETHTNIHQIRFPNGRYG